jgi:senataxin
MARVQVKLLRDAFSAALGEEAAKLVDVNTIDGFQGREKDIVIFSCVRWGQGGW